MSDRTQIKPTDLAPRPLAGSLSEIFVVGREMRLPRVRRILRAARRWIADPLSFSKLSTRIVALNVVALAFTILGVLYLSQFRAGLIDLQIKSLTTQAELIALTIAENAGEAGESPGEQRYDRIVANEVLRRMALPTGLRAQLYDRQGRLTGDTRSLLGEAVITRVEPIAPGGSVGFFELIEDLYDRTMELFRPPLKLYREVPPAGISQDEEVYQAINGEYVSAQRINSEQELIVSVSVPVKRVSLVMGALVLSTEGGAIDEIVREERIGILQVFLVVFIVAVIVSTILAQTIARPLSALARAAEDGGARELTPLDPGRIDIPDLTRRRDEIGHLSGALRRMTDALYYRIDAIETFASDVAHEIKNPLSSLRSAVETMRRAKTPDAQERLLSVIEHDVRRLDRLVTDISNASRLDAELVREQREVFELSRLVDNVAAIAEMLSADRGVTVTASMAQPSVKIRGMEARLAQVLHNLLDNALSFSTPGDQLQFTVQDASLEGHPAVLMKVIDEGPGIPPENVESIFERFYSERPNQDFGSHSGLGLSICRQIIEAHGGRIWAENRTDRSGAVFSVLLPV